MILKSMFFSRAVGQLEKAPECSKDAFKTGGVFLPPEASQPAQQARLAFVFMFAC